jgi:erythromycin esterase-like protein
MPHFAFGLIKWTVSFSIFLGGCAQGETMFADYASSSNGNDDQAAIALVKQHAHRITGRANDYDPLLQMIGENRFVMLGEATHGTHEFYAERAKITQRLIKEKGFDAIVLEADWTDAFDVNRYVLGTSQARDADAALSGFTRFPKWMWANTDFRDLIANVRKINDSRSGGQHKVGVYGMDLYGADESALELTRYLQKVDESAAARARERYACLTSYRQGIEEYGSVVSRDPKRSCERPAIE